MPASAESDPNAAALGQRATRAAGWSFLNTAITRLSTLGIGIALARTLGPNEFGTFAVGLVALAAVLSFNELGVSLAIVRWKGDPEEIAPTVTTISVISSAILTLVVLLSAPAFAQAMGDPDATIVVQALSLCVLISGVVATPNALMQRHFLQRKRMIIDQINIWVGALLSITLAVGGLGAMSLAIGRVSASIISAALFIYFSPLPYRLGLSRQKLAPLLRFGLPLAASSVVVFGIGYVDQLAVGSFFGTTALGFYVLAFNLASWPVSLFSQPLRNVAPALFAKMQSHTSAMNSAFLSIFWAVAVVTLPVCFMLAGAAEPIVAFVYGNAWIPAASVLRFLALLAALRIFFELVYDFLVVLQRTRTVLIVQIVWFSILVPVTMATAPHTSLEGVAFVQISIAAVFVLPLYLVAMRRLGIGPKEFARRSISAVVLAFGVGATGLFAGRNLDPLIACVVSGFACCLAIALLSWGGRERLRELRSLSSIGA